ncbi:MAG: hypothetical protein AAB074_04710 [Planctomycetota bacterium]
MRKAMTVLPLVLALSACASSGRNFDESKVGNIKNGQTTKAEIEQWFGKPGGMAGVNGATNGAVQRYTYSYGYSSHGGSRTTAKALVVDFNDKDIVVDNAYSSQ